MDGLINVRFYYFAVVDHQQPEGPAGADVSVSGRLPGVAV